MDPVTYVREVPGAAPYQPVLDAMRTFTRERAADTADEIWIVEHAPVFTLGQAGLESHVLNAGDIPLVRSDRGGQVTYHGPGQLVLYPLVDLRRAGIGVKGLVSGLEGAVIAFLERHGIESERRAGAPGVYVRDAKVAALGLRVHKGCSYHGLSLNVAMSLEPFSRINPCGYEGLAVTDLAGLGVQLTLREAADGLLPHVIEALNLAPPQVAEPRVLEVSA